MSILSKIFSGAAKDLVVGVGGVIDNLHTSDEEKLAAEQKIKELISKHEVKMEKEISTRWNADMTSDSWLSKNVRPMVLIFLVVSTVLLVFIDAGVIAFEVKASWVDLLQLVLITVIGAYFGGRSLEKVKKTNNKN
mgnify:FL=1|jgi:hypothetical protein|tara:strand:- start:816 stop:1223 length:408 start_codon:yes stop_codon:yes gene_type:complete